MQITRFGDYAVRAIVHLATKKSGEIATSEEIANKQNIPLDFLYKIMKTLSMAGLVSVYRGKKGGFALAKGADDISVKDIIEAAEGPIYLNRCLMRKSECPSDTTCGVHPVWKEARDALVGVLDNYSAASLAKIQAKNLLNKSKKSK